MKVLTGNDSYIIKENDRITGEEIKRARQKIRSKSYKVRSNLKNLRNNQDEIFTETMNKLAKNDLMQTANYEGTKAYLRTQFVEEFCNALRSVSLNAYLQGTLL